MRYLKVGLLYFNEEFGTILNSKLNEADTFFDKNGIETKIIAEHILIHEIDLNYNSKYDVIIDRASFYFKMGISTFMMQAFDGINVINNPLSFHYFIANKDVGYKIAHSLGIKVPKTFILPQKHTLGFTKEQDFRFHRIFNWDYIIDKVKLPCYIKPAEGKAALMVNKAYTLEQLISLYDNSGSNIMTVQELIESPHDWHVRCICVGKKIIPIKFIFRKNDMSEYIYDENFLDKELENKIINSSKIINRAFGYEMNSIEFIIDHNNEPWAIDFNNPVPDGRLSTLGKKFFNDYINAMIDLVKDIGYNERQSNFLPELNVFSNIARKNITTEEKNNLSLEEANKYYEN